MLPVFYRIRIDIFLPTPAYIRYKKYCRQKLLASYLQYFFLFEKSIYTLLVYPVYRKYNTYTQDIWKYSNYPLPIVHNCVDNVDNHVNNSQNYPVICSSYYEQFSVFSDMEDNAEAVQFHWTASE